MSAASQGAIRNENQITISRLLNSRLKGILYAYRGKRIIFTLAVSLALAVFGTLLTVFVFPSLFSPEPTVNAAYGGFAVTLVVMTVMGVISDIRRKKGAWVAEMVESCALWVQGVFGKDAMLKERIFVIVLTVCGLVFGCVFSHSFMLLLSVALFFSAVSGEDGQILSLTAAVQNSFNNTFRKAHIRNPDAARRDLTGLAFGMLLTALIFTLIGGAAI